MSWESGRSNEKERIEIKNKIKYIEVTKWKCEEYGYNIILVEKLD